MHGLKQSTAELLLIQHGRNELPKGKKPSVVQKFILQLNNILVYLLLGAVAVSFTVRDYIEGLLILLIVVLNACIGVYQEGKAEEAIELLQKFTQTFVRVVRDGKEQEIDSALLVPGDVVYVEDGSKVPGDARVLKATLLELNEASMTGESLPIPKEAGDEVFMGTTVAKGRAHLEIIKTGVHTKFGQITANLKEIARSKTPLQQKIEHISRIIGLVGVLISVIVFGLSVFQGNSAYLALLLAISLAVAVVPEGLPAVMTVALSIGVKEMAKRKAIVRKMPAIETLGSITLIATDKTGTLTTNLMEVKEVFAVKPSYQDEIFQNSVLCSTASIVKTHHAESVSGRSDREQDFLGDPTEGAMLVYAQEQGINIDELRTQWKILDEVPFDSVAKQMRVRVERAGRTKIYIKGAPESLNGGKVPASVQKKLAEWSKKGYRVIGFAEGTTYLGAMALYDPPRPEAAEAISRARMAGVEVVMITGDAPETAEAIATQIGLFREGEEILTGAQLESYSDAELTRKLPKIRVFARTNPIQKSRIVRLYQTKGEIVAVTGDGVNDIVALKQANVGIAMGQVGTDVARDTADIVLSDDNFATIVNAVEEGRNIVTNLKNSLTYLFTGNFSEALTLVIGLSLGLPNLFYPIQLLYVNLVSDGLPALALAFSPRNATAMQEPPQREAKLLNRFDLIFIVTIGLTITVTVLGGYYYLAHIYSTLVARTGAFILLDLAQAFMFITLWLSFRPVFTNLRYVFHGMFALGFLIPFIAQLMINQIEPLDNLFHIQKLPLDLFLLLALASSVTIFVLPVIKFLARRQ